MPPYNSFSLWIDLNPLRIRRKGQNTCSNDRTVFFLVGGQNQKASPNTEHSCCTAARARAHWRCFAGFTGFGLLYSCLHTTALSAATTTEEDYAELGVTAGLTSPSPSWATCSSDWFSCLLNTFLRTWEMEIVNRKWRNIIICNGICYIRLLAKEKNQVNIQYHSQKDFFVCIFLSWG